MGMRIASLTRALFANGLSRAVIVLAAASGVALAATPARAQCADPEDIVEDVYDIFYDELGDEFFGFFDEEICDKLTQTVVKACQKAASDNAKCYERVYKSLLSGHKTACSTTGSDKSECNAFYKSYNDSVNAEIEFFEQDVSDDCEDEAGSFWDVCYSGIP
jgi:hypothetical protein